MACISVPTAILGAGALSAGTSLIQGGSASSAATQAANVQAASANRAADIQLAEFQSIQGQLQPYRTLGENATGALSNLTGVGEGPGSSRNPLTAPLTAPFQPTMGQLEGTPGYQFTKQQGLQATKNAFTAQGLGASGASFKGAVTFAEGLASTTYQQQFENYLKQNQQTFNMLGGLAA